MKNKTYMSYNPIKPYSTVKAIFSVLMFGVFALFMIAIFNSVV